jgi:hypothetical protein
VIVLLAEVSYPEDMLIKEKMGKDMANTAKSLSRGLWSNL